VNTTAQSDSDSEIRDRAFVGLASIAILLRLKEACMESAVLYFNSSLAVGLICFRASAPI
jgi:hypothetical protein